MENSDYKILQKFKAFLRDYVKEYTNANAEVIDEMMKDGGVEEVFCLFGGIFSRYLAFLKETLPDPSSVVSCEVSFKKEKINKAIN